MSTDVTVHSGAHAPALHDDPASLVRFAIERGVDVEVLERLVALQERVTERNARAAYFEALAAFQEECPEIRKTGKAKIATRAGTGFDYAYAPLDEIARTIRPYLKKHGLSYSHDVEMQGEVMNVICVLRHIDGHEERSTFPVPIDTKAAMSGAQKNGAALTYGKRQSLIAVLGLTTADDDNDAASRPHGRGRGAAEEEDGPISDRQLADLEALMTEVQADPERFTRWLGVAALAELPQSEYRRAVQALEAKRKGAQ